MSSSSNCSNENTAPPVVTVKAVALGPAWSAGGPVLDLARPRPDRFAISDPGAPLHLAAQGARFKVYAGAGRILCDMDPGRTDHMLALVGPALSFCLVARGLEPFHGTALARGGNGLFLLGASGSGKSTLAGALVSRGWTLLADDLFVPHIRGNRVVCRPGWPVLKLCAPAHRVLSQHEHVFAPGRWEECGKYLYPFPLPEANGSPPVAVRAVFLDPAGDGQSALMPFGGAECMAAWIRNTYNSCIADKARLARQFERCGRLAEILPANHLRFRHDLAALDALADLVISAVCRNP